MPPLVAPRRMQCVPPEGDFLYTDPRTSAGGRLTFCGPCARRGNGASRSRRLAKSTRSEPAWAIRPYEPEHCRLLHAHRCAPGGPWHARGASRVLWEGWPCGAVAGVSPCVRKSIATSVSPGHNERAGTRQQGRPGKGQRYRRRVLGQCAWATRKTPTCFGRTLRRVASRLGRKTAALAVAHTIVVIVSHLRRDGTCYAASRDERQEARQAARAKPRAWRAGATTDPCGQARRRRKCTPQGVHHRQSAYPGKDEDMG